MEVRMHQKTKAKAFNTWLHVTEEENGWPPRENNLCAFIKAEPAGEVCSFTFFSFPHHKGIRSGTESYPCLFVYYPGWIGTDSLCHFLQSFPQPVPIPHPKCNTQALPPLGGMDAETSCLFLLSSLCCVFPWNDSWRSCIQSLQTLNPNHLLPTGRPPPWRSYFAKFFVTVSLPHSGCLISCLS